MKIISIIFFLCMLALTGIGYSSTNTFIFAGGSTDSLMDKAVVNVAFSTILVLFFGFLLYSYFKKSEKIKMVLLGIIFLLWFLSGRTIGTIIYPDGKLITGWFYISTKNYELCNHKTDCEKVIYYQTKTERLPFWRIRVKNDNIDQVIFVGPFLWNSALKLFENKFGAGKVITKEDMHNS